MECGFTSDAIWSPFPDPDPNPAANVVGTGVLFEMVAAAASAPELERSWECTWRKGLGLFAVTTDLIVLGVLGEGAASKVDNNEKKCW